MSEQLPPLSDERLAELTQSTRNGPDVVAMALEIQAARKEIAGLKRACDVLREDATRQIERASERLGTKELRQHENERLTERVNSLSRQLADELVERQRLFMVSTELTANLDTVCAMLRTESQKHLAEFNEVSTQSERYRQSAVAAQQQVRLIAEQRDADFSKIAVSLGLPEDSDTQQVIERARCLQGKIARRHYLGIDHGDPDL